MSRWIAPALAAVVAAAACTEPPRAASAPASGPSVEDTVWAAALDSLYVDARTRQLVVFDRTGGTTSNERMAESFGFAAGSMGAEPGTVDDFRARNREPRAVGPLPRTRVPVVLVDSATIATLPDSVDLHPNEPMQFWRAFHARYPDSSGLITLSRVGFNAARTQALLNVDRGCGGLCGDGTVILLTRSAEGRWRVTATRGTWVS